MVAAMLEDSLCLPAHFAIQYVGNLQSSETCISKTFDLTDIKVIGVVKKMPLLLLTNCEVHTGKCSDRTK